MKHKKLYISLTVAILLLSLFSLGTYFYLSKSNSADNNSPTIDLQPKAKLTTLPDGSQTLVYVSSEKPFALSDYFDTPNGYTISYKLKDEPECDVVLKGEHTLLVELKDDKGNIFTSDPFTITTFTSKQALLLATTGKDNSPVNISIADDYKFNCDGIDYLLFVSGNTLNQDMIKVSGKTNKGVINALPDDDYQDIGIHSITFLYTDKDDNTTSFTFPMVTTDKTKDEDIKAFILASTSNSTALIPSTQDKLATGVITTTSSKTSQNKPANGSNSQNKQNISTSNTSNTNSSDVNQGSKPKTGHYETVTETIPAWDEQVLVQEGYWESVCVQEAYDEPIYVTVTQIQETWQRCGICGWECKDSSVMYKHIGGGAHEGGNFYSVSHMSDCEPHEVVSHYVSHSAKYEDRWVEPVYETVHHDEEVITKQVWVED